MSLLSSFIASHLIPALEAELVQHAPEVQAFLLKQIQDLTAHVATWVEGKVAAVPAQG